MVSGLGFRVWGVNRVGNDAMPMGKASEMGPSSPKGWEGDDTDISPSPRVELATSYSTCFHCYDFGSLFVHSNLIRRQLNLIRIGNPLKTGGLGLKVERLDKV